MSDAQIRAAFFDQLSAESLYKIMELRSQVFVVEQKCVYLDLDGRDLESDCLQMWIEENGEVLANLRVLHDSDGSIRISRVATAVKARGRGLAGQLINDVIENETGLIKMDAQAYLERWYAGFGFSTVSEPFIEDGIEHVTMELRR